MKTIASPCKACIFVLSFMSLFLLFIINGCKKNESSPTAPAAQPSFTFTLNGTSYSGEVAATYERSIEWLTVSSRVTSSTGSPIIFQIFFSDTSIIKVNKSFDLYQGGNSPVFAHVCVGDTSYDNTFCTRSEGGGTLTVTKWNGSQISATFGLTGGTHLGAPTRRFCTVTNGTFEAKSIVVVP